METHEEYPRTILPTEHVNEEDNVVSCEKKTRSKSDRLETTETGLPLQHQFENEEPHLAVEYQQTAEQAQRCHYLFETVERDLHHGRRRKQAAFQDLEEFLSVLSRRYELNPRFNDSLTSYCTVLWEREEYVRKSVWLCAWLDLFAKSTAEIRKFDTVAHYIDHITATTKDMTPMGGQTREVAIEFESPKPEDALSKLSDTKINIVEQISVRKIRGMVADIYRKNKINPPRESEETSRAIQLLLEKDKNHDRNRKKNSKSKCGKGTKCDKKHEIKFESNESTDKFLETPVPQHQVHYDKLYQAVKYQETAKEVQRCYSLLKMVGRELRLGRGREQGAWRDLKEFLTIMSKRSVSNPPSFDSLTAYCTVLWMRDEYVQTLALLCAWLDLFASAKPATEIGKSDTISIYIDYLAVTTEKLMTTGGVNRKIAIEVGLPVLEDALPRLSDTKINIVEQVSVRKIRRIVADIHRMEGRNPPWESSGTSDAIQLLLDQLRRPLDEIGYSYKALLLTNFMEIQEDRSVDDLVKLAECELYLNRGRGNQVLQNLQDVLRSCTVIGRLSARAKINDLWNTEHHLKLFIYAFVWCDIFSREELSDDADYEDTVLQNTVNLELTMRKLVESGGEEQRIAMEYGVPKITDVVQDLLNSGISNGKVTSLQNRVVIYQTLDLMEYVFIRVVNLRNTSHNDACPGDGNMGIFY